MNRPTRSDARRNEERLRDAAREVLSARGIDVPLQEIAQAAAVSIGTLYNHFGSREGVVEAVLPELARQQFERIAAAASGAAPARQRLSRYLGEVFAIQAEDRLLSDVLGGAHPVPEEVALACRGVLDLGAKLLAETQAEGDSTGGGVVSGQSPGVQGFGAQGFDAQGFDAQSLDALIRANSIVHRVGAPEGWDRFLRQLSR